MKYPKFVTNKIYVASPSMGCATSYYKPRFKKAVKNFKELGFKVTLGPYVFNDGILSSSPKNLGEEINKNFSNHELIISAAGGEVMMQILPFIDYELLKNSEPSWFLGYSDNTNLHFLLNTYCDIASIYGGCMPEFGTDSFIRYQRDHISLIKGEKLKFKGYPKYEIIPAKCEEHPYANLNMTEPSIISTYPNNINHLHGRIIGGCIDVLACLVGTKFDHMKEFNNKYDDILFLFEACDMNPMEVHRALLQLKYAGWFYKASGFVFGRPIIKDDMFNLNYKELIIDALKEIKKPIVFDLDIGHIKPQVPVILGSICDINIKDGKYEISYHLE